MFRKAILTAVLAAATLTGLAVTPSTAQAAGPFDRDRDRGFDRDRDHDHGHRHRYEVLVRHGFHWDVHGVYRDRDDAERAAHRLQHRGFQVRIQMMR